MWKVFSETPKQLSRSANLSRLKTGKSENKLRFCGMFWPKSSKFSHLKAMAQVPHWPCARRHFTNPRHERSKRRFWKTSVLTCPFRSGQLFSLVAPELFFVVLFVKCCTRSSLKPTWTMYDGSWSRPPHAYKWGQSMSLDWPVDPIARVDQSRPSSSPADASDEQQRGSLPASIRSRWRQDTLQSPQVQQGIAGRDTCGHFSDWGLWCISWDTSCLVGSVFSSQKNRELKLIFHQDLWQHQHHLDKL